MCCHAAEWAIGLAGTLQDVQPCCRMSYHATGLLIMLHNCILSLHFYSSLPWKLLRVFSWKKTIENLSFGFFPGIFF
ncbi:unnamed protein product [Blepharisma stoltei]|uniref:Uncharacterized protein n=1 Tax=Blepharisma stoltei TaxID=1481888 RepID=A0AAU9JVW4_9CILI|nr:unnamed protein product [Blepharisma stoltei]